MVLRIKTLGIKTLSIKIPNIKSLSRATRSIKTFWIKNSA